MHAANRAAWDEAAERYEGWFDEAVALIRAGGTNLFGVETALIGDLHGRCHRAIHLQCAAGRDTLSLWNHGAEEVVGIDFSPRMLELAARLTEATGAPARWVLSDVLDTPAELDGTADLVYTGRGSLIWLQDLDAWAAVIARLLSPTGRFVLFEGHPAEWLFDASPRSASRTWSSTTRWPMTRPATIPRHPRRDRTRSPPRPALAGRVRRPPAGERGGGGEIEARLLRGRRPRRRSTRACTSRGARRGAAAANVASSVTVSRAYPRCATPRLQRRHRVRAGARRRGGRLQAGPSTQSRSSAARRARRGTRRRTSRDGDGAVAPRDRRPRSPSRACGIVRQWVQPYGA